ncbi:MAG: putative toxin-antitoxin system toxin component, PIN family [Actinobacteria bacterium]|nr:MAG: putative toxin-antitoxin system toxin component, PIN family [Actinomycetota bacterium]
MLRAVLDTNIVVSGTISSSGAPYDVLQAWRQRRFTLVTSPDILLEIQRVFDYPKIRKSYDLEPKTIKAIIARLNKYSVVTAGKVKVSAIDDDPTDNMFLACAKEAEADFIVTGDSHLLDLKSFEGIPIVSPRYFLNTLDERAKNQQEEH